jgi:hypothetical protein
MGNAGHKPVARYLERIFLVVIALSRALDINLTYSERGMR